jgi:citrate lyase subunit beta/citryl-CoA lyase
MRALSPAEVLFDGVPRPNLLPVCDHYAGSEKLMRRSLALQASMGPVFDVTLDCEDGAASLGAHADLEHAALVASMLNHETNRFGRVGVRIHDYSHRAWREEVRIILNHGAREPAYVTLPKVVDVRQAQEMCEFIEASRRPIAARHNAATRMPVQLLIETHGALEQVHALAALPAVEALSFGLMDFVSAHHGAIPASAMRSPGQFDHPLVRRAKLEIAAACHAHGKVASHNVSTEIRDMAVVADDARRARDQFGYTRMWSIHPEQIKPIVTAFLPDATETENAARILLAAQATGWGPVRDGDQLHDRASYRYFWSVLSRARAGAGGVELGISPALAAAFKSLLDNPGRHADLH